MTIVAGPRPGSEPLLGAMSAGLNAFAFLMRTVEAATFVWVLSWLPAAVAVVLGCITLSVPFTRRKHWMSATAGILLGMSPVFMWYFGFR
jgi:hypothetical protein